MGSRPPTMLTPFCAAYLYTVPQRFPVPMVIVFLSELIPRLLRFCKASNTPSWPTPLKPGETVWPPLRVANFVLSTFKSKMILDKSLLVLGVTTQAGSNQHVCDLERLSAFNATETELLEHGISWIPRTKGFRRGGCSMWNWPEMFHYGEIVFAVSDMWKKRCQSRLGWVHVNHSSEVGMLQHLCCWSQGPKKTERKRWALQRKWKRIFAWWLYRYETRQESERQSKRELEKQGMRCKTCDSICSLLQKDTEKMRSYTSFYEQLPALLKLHWGLPVSLNIHVEHPCWADSMNHYWMPRGVVSETGQYGWLLDATRRRRIPKSEAPSRVAMRASGLLQYILTLDTLHIVEWASSGRWYEWWNILMAYSKLFLRLRSWITFHLMHCTRKVD